MTEKSRAWKAANQADVSIYHNQTAILVWLRDRGHKVDFRDDPTAPRIDLEPIKYFFGTPCPYCGITMGKRGPRAATKDHLIPRKYGFALTATNRVICCAPCNSDKDQLLIEEWHLALKTKGDPQAQHIEAFIVNAERTGIAIKP